MWLIWFDPRRIVNNLLFYLTTGSPTAVGKPEAIQS